jgi:hypothetical protein
MKHNYITYFIYLEGLLASETLVLFKKLQLDPELDPSAIILQSLNRREIYETMTFERPPNERTFKQVLDAFEEHCNPKKLDTAGRLVANSDQNHIWATRYCQNSWHKFKYLGEYKYYSIYILLSGYSIK